MWQKTADIFDIFWQFQGSDKKCQKWRVLVDWILSFNNDYVIIRWLGGVMKNLPIGIQTFRDSKK